MEVSLNAATSGMRVSSQRHDITAHNVANVNTPGFSELRPRQAELAGGGTALSGAVRMPNPDPATSNTDLAEQTKEQIQNKNAFGANAAVIKMQDRMIGELLDMVG